LTVIGWRRYGSGVVSGGAGGPRSLVSVHRELWELVHDEIKSLIIGGEFAPGDPLVEASLAARFGVSRGPVRTALMELERVGLAQSLPRRGMQVSTLSEADFDELFDVIAGLERLAARAAAAHVTTEQVDDLNAMLDALDAAQHQGGPTEAVEADLELHRHLVRASGNRRLLGLWTAISEEIRFVISVTQRALPDVEWATFNRPIVEAVAAGDADRAEAAVVACFDGARTKLRAAWAEAIDLVGTRGAKGSATRTG
jgi:DNA-binding GntR family transcriptional regulator